VVKRITVSVLHFVTQQWRARRVPGFHRDRAYRHGFDHALAQQAHRLSVTPRSRGQDASARYALDDLLNDRPNSVTARAV
jgi:hypothetical protein